MIAKCNRRLDMIRAYQARRDAYETMHNLYGQASRTRKCLEMLNNQGAVILQATVDLFAAQEKKFGPQCNCSVIVNLPYISPRIQSFINGQNISRMIVIRSWMPFKPRYLLLNIFQQRSNLQTYLPNRCPLLYFNIFFSSWAFKTFHYQLEREY